MKFTLGSELRSDKMQTVVWLPPRSRYSSFIPPAPLPQISLCTFCRGSFLFYPLSLATSDLFSVLEGPCGFVILRISYEWNHTICSLLSLSIMHLKLIHVVCISTSFLFVAEWYSWNQMYLSLSIPIWSIFGLFLVFGNYEATVNIHDRLFISLE